jgi:hypothetical protein
LGHHSFTLTLDVYGDYILEHDGGAANTLPEQSAPERLDDANGRTATTATLDRRLWFLKGDGGDRPSRSLQFVKGICEFDL